MCSSISQYFQPSLLYGYFHFSFYFLKLKFPKTAEHRKHYSNWSKKCVLWGLLSSEDESTFGVLVGIWSSRSVYVELSQNKPQCECSRWRRNMSAVSVALDVFLKQLTTFSWQSDLLWSCKWSLRSKAVVRCCYRVAGRTSDTMVHISSPTSSQHWFLLNTLPVALWQQAWTPCGPLKCSAVLRQEPRQARTPSISKIAAVHTSMILWYRK